MIFYLKSRFLAKTLQERKSWQILRIFYKL
jgi:hypothetical protein